MLKLYEFKYSNINRVTLITKKKTIRKYLSMDFKHEINNVCINIHKICYTCKSICSLFFNNLLKFLYRIIIICVLIHFINVFFRFRQYQNLSNSIHYSFI